MTIFEWESGCLVLKRIIYLFIKIFQYTNFWPHEVVLEYKIHIVLLIKV